MKDKVCNVCDNLIADRTSSLKKHMKVHENGHKVTRKFKVKRNLGSDEHLKRALKSHISFNSVRVGSPDRLMSIRKSSPRSPLAL